MSTNFIHVGLERIRSSRSVHEYPHGISRNARYASGADSRTKTLKRKVLLFGDSHTDHPRTGFQYSHIRFGCDPILQFPWKSQALKGEARQRRQSKKRTSRIRIVAVKHDLGRSRELQAARLRDLSRVPGLAFQNLLLRQRIMPWVRRLTPAYFSFRCMHGAGSAPVSPMLQIGPL